MATGSAKEILHITYPVIVSAVMPHLNLCIHLKMAGLGVLAAVVPRHYGASLAVGVETHSPPCVVMPVAVLIGNLVLAYIVHLGIDSRAAPVGEVGGKDLCHILAVRSATEVGIYVPLRLVLLLYLEVDNGSLVRIVYTGKLLLLIGLLVHGYVLYSIAHDVGHCSVGIAYERLAVDKY